MQKFWKMNGNTSLLQLLAPCKKWVPGIKTLPSCSRSCPSLPLHLVNKKSWGERPLLNFAVLGIEPRG